MPPNLILIILDRRIGGSVPYPMRLRTQSDRLQVLKDVRRNLMAVSVALDREGERRLADRILDQIAEIDYKIFELDPLWASAQPYPNESLT